MTILDAIQKRIDCLRTCLEIMNRGLSDNPEVTKALYSVTDAELGFLSDLLEEMKKPENA